MAEKDNKSKSKNYREHIPYENKPFFLKGMGHADWGMKSRLSQIFDPKDGKTVMLAFDHGYIMGPTSGLERLDLDIKDLVEEVDVLMATRGALKTCIEPNHNKGIALRSTAGSSVLDDDMSHEVLAVDIEDAIRMNASCIAVQTFIGASGEKESIDNLCKAVDMGNKYGIPVLGVVAVGKQMERTTEFFLLATRMLAEFGASIVKTYYCDNFEQVVAACPVPIVIAGGKKLPELEALQMVDKAIKAGAAGVDMGRNVFQAENPKMMARAIKMIVHENHSAEEAYQFYINNK